MRKESISQRRQDEQYALSKWSLEPIFDLLIEVRKATFDSILMPILQAMQATVSRNHRRLWELNDGFNHNVETILRDIGQGKKRSDSYGQRHGRRVDLLSSAIQLRSLGILRARSRCARIIGTRTEQPAH